VIQQTELKKFVMDGSSVLKLPADCGGYSKPKFSTQSIVLFCVLLVKACGLPRGCALFAASIVASALAAAHLNSTATLNDSKLGELGESHPRVAAGIKNNAMIVKEIFGNLARLIIREYFGDLGNLVATVDNSLI
jgi:hypothetical protein